MQWSETSPRETCDATADASAVAPRLVDAPCPNHPLLSDRSDSTESCGPSECGGGGHSSDQAEPCPSPLGWSQVLEQFRAESTPVEIEGTRGTLRGRCWGEGPPLCFLPGLSETINLYALVLYVLRDQFQCFLFDRIEPRRGNRLDLGDEVADLFTVADELGHRRLSLYATGSASLTALSAMFAEPDRIERAVLQGGFARRPLTIFERTALRAGRFAPGALKQLPLRRAIALRNHRPWFPPFDDSRFEFYLAATGEIPLARAAARADLVRRTDLRPRLPRIATPVLLLRTEGEGAIASRCQDELAAGLSLGRNEYLPNCGQLPYLTHPHRTAKIVSEFLTAPEPHQRPEVPAAASPDATTN